MTVTAEHMIFLGMVFLTVFLLARSVMVPTVSTEARLARRLRSRISGVVQTMDADIVSLLREKHLRDLSGIERWIERLPGMERIALMIEQAGWKTPAYRLALVAAIVGAGMGLLVLTSTRQPLLALLVALVGAAVPLLKLRNDRNKRLADFEAQLPDALDTMGRALRAGHPFTETLQMVGDEMPDPIAGEFRTTFADINYGMSVKSAFVSLLQRVPSMSLMAVVTAVLVQYETGGNMAEILDKIAGVVRGRFRFQRKVRTLSAEGRLSAWILSLVPFALAGMLWLSSPEYLPMLTKDPLGVKLIFAAFIFIALGIFWIRRIVRIDV